MASGDAAQLCCCRGDRLLQPPCSLPALAAWHAHNLSLPPSHPLPRLLHQPPILPVVIRSAPPSPLLAASDRRGARLPASAASLRPVRVHRGRRACAAEAGQALIHPRAKVCGSMGNRGRAARRARGEIASACARCRAALRGHSLGMARSALACTRAWQCAYECTPIRSLLARTVREPSKLYSEQCSHALYPRSPWCSACAVAW